MERSEIRGLSQRRSESQPRIALRSIRATKKARAAPGEDFSWREPCKPGARWSGEAGLFDN